MTSLRRLARSLVFSLVLPASAFLGSASLMRAATLTVINNSDSGPGSLRQAILTSASGDSIVFDPSLNNENIILTTGELEVTTNLTITGPGANLLAIEGGAASRVFHFMGGTATISGLNIAEGFVTGGDGAAGDGGGGGGGGMGGGLLADWSSTVFIHDMVFSGNQAQGGAGGANDGSDNSDAGGAGGAGNGGATGALAGTGGTSHSIYVLPLSGGAAGANVGGGGGGGASGYAGLGAAPGSGGNGSFGGGGGGGGGTGNSEDPDVGLPGFDSWGFGGMGGFGNDSYVGGSGGGGGGLGGAICVWQGAFVVLSNVTFYSNVAAGGDGGGGAESFENGTTGQGKGAAIFVCAGGVAEETNLVFVGDSSSTGGTEILATDGLVLDNNDVYGSFLSLNPVTNAIFDADDSLWTDNNGDFFTNDTQSIPGEVVDWVANRDAFGNLDATALQFNLSAVGGPVGSAFLRIHVSESLGLPYLTVYGSLDDSWAAGNTNMPATLDYLLDLDDTNNLAAGDWKYIDVTSYVNSILADTQVASFELTNDIGGNDFPSGDGFAFDSWQSSNSLVRPALLLTPAAPPTPVGTTLFLYANANPSAWGAPVTLSLQVVPDTGVTAPAGLVEFFANGTLLASTNLAPEGFAGAASITVTNLPVGVDSILAQYSGDSNNDASTNTISQTVNPAPQAPLVFTLDEPLIYGSAIPLSASGGSGLGAVSFAVLSGPAQIMDGTNLDITAGFGEVDIQVTKASDADFAEATTNAIAAAFPANLSIIDQPQSKLYGAALPALTVNYSGFVNNDTLSNLTTLPTIITTATADSPVGNYAITASGAVDSNYLISYFGGTLSITPALLTFTANGATRPYGTTNPIFTGTIAGLVGEDAITATYSSDALTNSPAGMYQIIPTLVDPLNLAGNYNVFLVDADLDVLAVLVLSTNPSFYVVGAAPISLDTNAMVDDGNSINYAGGLLTVTIVTNASAEDALAVSSQGTNAGQIGVLGASISYGGVSFATLSETSNALDFVLGTNSVTSAMLAALLRQVTFATGDASTNARVIQVALDYGSNIVFASRVLLLDSLPVATNVVLEATKGFRITIPIDELLTNVSDADGFLISLASVDSLSEAGGIITSNAGTLTYTPPNNLTANQDEFAVSYSDGHGGETVGFVTLEFLPPNQIQIDATNIATTGVQLTLGGIPNHNYQIQVSADLMNWVLLETLRATPTGIINVLDAAAKNFPYRFYRALEESFD
jgi:hypothetical protein